MVNGEELIGTTQYLTLQTRCHIDQCHYNRVQLCIKNPSYDLFYDTLRILAYVLLNGTMIGEG
jgi:hypothetical protein